MKFEAQDKDAWQLLAYWDAPNSATYLLFGMTTFAQCCSKEASLASWGILEKRLKQLKTRSQPTPALAAYSH